MASSLTLPLRTQPRTRQALWLAAPLVAVLAGLAAEFLDFRALRVPLLLMVGLGVLGTSYAATQGRPGVREFAIAVAIGAATWAAAESLYVVLHVAAGEAFEAERFGPQWAQALGLIGAHGLFLGVPTGIAAGVLLHLGALARGLVRR